MKKNSNIKIDINHVAKLANLPLNQDEKTTYERQLIDILSYIEKIEELDTQNVETTFNVTNAQTVERGDKEKSSLSQADALKNAKSKNGFFITKGVFESE